jgi:hypothetical protein
VLTEAVDPATGEPARLFDPRRDRWERHFEAVAQTGHIRGLTAAGRATAAALRLNGPARVLTRRLWIAVGWWP